MRLILGIVLLAVIIILLITVIWLIFFRDAYSLFALLKMILDLALLPFKLILQLFGWGQTTITIQGEQQAPPPSQQEQQQPAPSQGQQQPPTVHTTQTEIIKHELGECPPCNVTCPEPQPCPDAKPLEMEIGYLKNMIKFVGAMAKRENAINAQYRELYPGFSVMSPHVRRLTCEYNFIKNQLREDENQWTYFKNYFTKLTGIPSTSSAIHYDIVV